MHRRTVVIVLALVFVVGFAGRHPALAEPDSITPATIPAATAEPAAGPQHGGTLIISLGGGTPAHFNPALASGHSITAVGRQIFASPLRYDDNWNPQPYLARDWELSEDGLSVTLHLVEDATFHDGQPITSEDVAFSIMTVKEYHPFKSMFAPVERVETPDPHTVLIRLSQPHPVILLCMSPPLLPILPKHIYGDGQDLRTHPSNLAPVGSGPFRLVEYIPDKLIILERNDHYFIPERPYLDRIIIRLEPDPKAQVIELERQEAHLSSVFTDFNGLERLARSEHLVVTPRGYETTGTINWLAFNLLLEPLNDKRVRQAIAYAIDADFIVEQLHHDRSRRATGPISPDSPFYEADVPTYELDLTKAAQLLDEAGYPLQPDGVRFSLTIDYVPLIPSQQRDVALYIKRQLSQLGIDVEVRKSANTVEWATRVGNWDFDMTMDGVSNYGDPVIGVHRTYLCDNVRKGVVWSNTQNYCNPEVDRILNQAERELDITKRKTLYSEFQKIVTEELPIIWINLLPLHTIYHVGLGNPPVSIWGPFSSLDEVYWKEIPNRVYSPIPEIEEDTPLVKKVGVQAIALLQEAGLYEALEAFRDPGRGYLDLEGTGLHVIGVTREGTVFLDNSGQMKAGMDISDLLDLEGDPLVPLFLKAAEGADGGYVTAQAALPHPGTNKFDPMTAWCGELSESDVVCALVWND